MNLLPVRPSLLPVFIRAAMSTFTTITTTHKPPLIATHDGKFHADEALACYMLKLLPELQNANIIRTRDMNIINEADIAVDIGGQYDHSRFRYDHHQRTFTLDMNSIRGETCFSDIKLSSAGLVYHHFGERIVSKILEDLSPTQEQVKAVFEKMYHNFIKEIDAVDNGVPMADNPKYEIRTGISSRVSKLMPNWCEESNPEILMERFLRAVELIGGEFAEGVNYYGRYWWKAKALVRKAIENRKSVHPTGEIINLQDGGVPWREHLFDLEDELDIQGQLKYVLFTDLNGQWRTQAVPVSVHSFVLRTPLRAEWQGLRESDLIEKSGIKDCIFVHATGFIGGNKNFEGALEMALKSLDSPA